MMISTCLTRLMNKHYMDVDSQHDQEGRQTCPARCTADCIQRDRLYQHDHTNTMVYIYQMLKKNQKYVDQHVSGFIEIMKFDWFSVMNGNQNYVFLCLIVLKVERFENEIECLYL